MELKMKKATRVVIAGACAAALALGTAIPAFAVDNHATKDTMVSYNTSTGTSTDNVGWQVFIPSSITFTADSTIVPFQLKLDSKTGTSLDKLTDLPGSGGVAGKGSVDIRVWSANTMALKIVGATVGQEDPLDYSLTVGDVTASKSTTGIADKTKGIKLATLTSDTEAKKNIADGKATVTGLPQKDGNHTDTLTFAFWDGTGTDPYAGV